MAFLASAPAALLIVGVTLAGTPGPQDASADDVKAAFLYNFTRFITWPEGTPAGSDPFRLCIMADAGITRAIEHTMAGETINDRPAETVVVRGATEARSCQMLFVGGSSAEQAKPVLAELRDLPILTVGESRGFLLKGGTIEFVMEHGRVRFDINLTSAERAGLTISSRLLRVARRILPRR